MNGDAIGDAAKHGSEMYGGEASGAPQHPTPQQGQIVLERSQLLSQGHVKGMLQQAETQIAVHGHILPQSAALEAANIAKQQGDSFAELSKKPTCDPIRQQISSTDGSTSSAIHN